MVYRLSMHNRHRAVVLVDGANYHFGSIHVDTSNKLLGLSRSRSGGRYYMRANWESNPRQLALPGVGHPPFFCRLGPGCRPLTLHDLTVETLILN